MFSVPTTAAGDRTHIPEGSKLIFNVLTKEIRRLRQITPVGFCLSLSEVERGS